MVKKKINIIKTKIFKSEFNRNVMKLMTGTTIAQAIPIAITPILTRLYSPEDFGLFAIFIATTSVLSSFANGKYELAIMLPQKDEDAINIFALGFIITILLSLILLVFIFFFNNHIIRYLGKEELNFWLYFIPLSIFFLGLWNLLNYFNIRKKNYKNLSNTLIVKSIFMAIIQISIGYAKAGVTGLLSGYLISQMIANIRLLKNTFLNKLTLSKITKSKLLVVSKKYVNFPKYSMFSTLINRLSQNLLEVFISIFYNISTLGFFSLTKRVLTVPTVIIGRAIGDVFFQQAAKEKQQTGSSIKSFKNSFIKLFFLSLLIFPFIYFFVSDIFLIFFGKKWIKAGEYAQILTPLIAIQFIVSPLTRINQIYLKNKNVLLWQFGLLIIYTSVMYVSNFFNFEFSKTLWIITIIISSYYLFHLLLLYLYIRND